MARNAEVTRQWQVLRDIDAARTGITIPKLAAAREVHQRTIRRDIDALSCAGFPIYDEKINGTTMWKLRARPFRGLEEMGLSMMELCALYFSRALLSSLAGAPFQDDAERALDKIQRALPAGCRKFLDGLPVAIKAKFAGRTKYDPRKTREVVQRVTEALLAHRRLAMRYHSHSSQRTRDYVVEPLRMSYADGGTYLTAFVPAYGETRTFAIERIRALSTMDEAFAPRPLPTEPFTHSLGAHSGSPERVELEFNPSVAGYVTTREWHRSQRCLARADGSVLMQLDVCIDRPLRTWILGFGAAVRVIAPEGLALEICDTLDEARAAYSRRLQFPRVTPGFVEGQRPQARGADLGVAEGRFEIEAALQMTSGEPGVASANQLAENPAGLRLDGRLLQAGCFFENRGGVRDQLVAGARDGTGFADGQSCVQQVERDQRRVHGRAVFGAEGTMTLERIDRLV